MTDTPTPTATTPTNIVIFGGTGDLAKTKLFPALLDLYVAGQLPEKFSITGLSRKELSDEEYQDFVRQSIAKKGHQHDDDTVHAFCTHIHYVAGNFTEADSYEQVKTALQTYDDSIGQCTNKLFYLAVPPQYYEVIFEHLHTSDVLALCDGVDSWSRLLVEKPFGRDLVTAQALEKKLCSLFADEQIYRIDHYLAKDAIENIIALRFANSVLVDSWDGAAIESVYIKMLETKDVSNRGSFYDAIGTLRDVGQNHMLQIFALLTMPPADIHNPQAIRAARADALKLLQKHTLTNVVRAQYQGYGDIPDVAEGSETETYFKLGFRLDDGAWQGTEFTLEAGKALNEKINETIITFKPRDICSCSAKNSPHEHRNVLRITFAPEQRICLSMWTKAPELKFSLHEQELTLLDAPGEDSASPEAYERVLFDCIAGDQTRFVSGDEVELAWQFITPILEQFTELPLHTYAPGARGPEDVNNT
jgi:glucose-6-phosphate 1-dehydrogenase